jgi:hypothetical protein
MSTQHPDFSKLAARISVSNLHKDTNKLFSDNVELMHDHVHPKTKAPAPLVSEDFYAVVQEHKERINSSIIHDRDFDYEYFGFKTLEKGYLCRLDGKVIERPQHMIMRVAIGIHLADIEAALETYELMSQRFFTHATPTLFNAGTTRPQLSSCFLLTMTEDSIEGIYDTLKRCACISKCVPSLRPPPHAESRRRLVVAYAGRGVALAPEGAVWSSEVSCARREGATRRAVCACRSRRSPSISVSCALSTCTGTPEASALRCTTSARPTRTSAARTARRTGLCRCSASSTTRRATSTRAAASARARSRCTSSRGTPTSAR